MSGNNHRPALLGLEAIDGPGERAMARRLSDAYTEPLDVQTFNGEVVITGPGPIAVSLTAAAAAKTAERLAAAAASLTRHPHPQPPTTASHESTSDD